MRPVRRVLAATAVLAVAALTGCSPDEAPAPAVKAPVVKPVLLEPYGGCDEAWQAPGSAGAADCRALGWEVTARGAFPPCPASWSNGYVLTKTFSDGSFRCDPR